MRIYINRFSTKALIATEIIYRDCLQYDSGPKVVVMVFDWSMPDTALVGLYSVMNEQIKAL